MENLDENNKEEVKVNGNEHVEVNKATNGDNNDNNSTNTKTGSIILNELKRLFNNTSNFYDLLGINKNSTLKNKVIL